MSLPFSTRQVVAVGLLLAAPSASLLAANSTSPALKNPGFESEYRSVVSTAHSKSSKANISGVVADGWHDNSDWAPVTANYAQETEFPHEGASAQRIEIESIKDGRLQFVQPVHMDADKVYRGSFWLRASGFETLDLCLQRRKAPFRAIASKTVVLSPEWREYSVSGMVEEDTDVFLMLAVEKTGGNTVTVWVDDAKWENMDAVALDAPKHEGNLLNNGSFETDLSGGWGVWVREYNRLEKAISTEFDDDRPTMDSATAVDGQQSMRIDIPDARAAVITSPWVPFNYNRPHTASIALKATKPTLVYFYIEGAPESRKSVTIDDQWRRYETSAVVPYAESTQMVVRFWPSEEVTVWADAAQLEEEPQATPEYVPAFPVELGLTIPRPGGIVFDGEPVPVVVTTGGEPLPEGAKLLWEVKDLLAGTTALPAVSLPTGSGEGVRVETEIKPDAERPRGMFKVRGQVVDAQGEACSAPVEVIFARLPRPRELDAERSFFGAHCHLTPYFIELLRATGFRWVRLHDTGNLTKWRYVEENKGQFVYQDEGVDAARAAGLEILGMLDGAPPWASKEPDALLGNHSVYNFPDIEDVDDYWGRYVRNTVRHYKGKIDNWEVWNEPWAEGARFHLPADLYAEFLMRAYSEAKLINPDSTIVGVNSVAHSSMGDAFTAEVLEIAGTEFFDVFSVHNYNPTLYGGAVTAPDNIVRKFDALMAEYGTVKPIWNTEGGPGTTLSWYWAGQNGSPLVRRQLAQIVRFDVAQIAAGISRFFYYNVYHHQVISPVGFIGVEHDRTIRPILAASAVLASLIDGAQCEGRVTPQEGLEGYRFVQDDGMEVLVLWSADGAAYPYAVPQGAEIWDVLGNTLVADTVNVSEEPVYVIFKHTH